MIESTVSRGAGVTSSPPGTLSTWQLGVKHSITKRCTRGPCREVRLVPVAGPRRVRAAPGPLSVQVERGVEGCSAKGCAGNRSWLKRYGGVRGNRSVDRRTRAGVPSAPVRPGRGASPMATPGGAIFGHRTGGCPTGWCRAGDRRVRGRRVSGRPAGRPGRSAFRLAEEDTADAGDRGEAEGRSRRAGEGGAVPDEDDRDEDAAERRPADHVRGGVGGVGRGLGGASRRRGDLVGFGGGPGCGAVCGHCGLPPGSLGCDLPGFNACSTCRSLVLLDRVAVGGVFARPRSRGAAAPTLPHSPWRHDCPRSRRPCGKPHPEP